MDWSLGPHHPRESQSEQPHLLLSESMAVFLLQMPPFRLKENRECECCVTRLRLAVCPRNNCELTEQGQWSSLASYHRNLVLLWADSFPGAWARTEVLHRARKCQEQRRHPLFTITCLLPQA